MTPRKKKIILWTVAAVVVLGGFTSLFVWYKFFREEPEPHWANEAERFKYGSIGAESARGIPYWIWLVLPRVFPDYLPASGGYKSFGLVWEEGHEMPVGFTKRVIGFPRVANNCAICHVGTWRSKVEEVPHVVVAAPANTVDVQSLLRFLAKCGADSRFNAATLLAAIKQETNLSFVDRLIYRMVLIPFTRKALIQQQQQFAWMNRPGWPDWGIGRDDPMNLTKYFMTSMPVDNTTGQADFPSNWNLQTRKGTNLFLNWSCDTPAVRSVLIDSALGLGAAPDKSNPIDRLVWAYKRRPWFVKRMEDLDNFLSELPPPKYPFPINTNLAYTVGKPLYDRLCADCHEPGKPRTNTPVPLTEIGTDRERMDTWTQAAADQANAAVKQLGIIRPNMVKQEGYQSMPLDGLWMRAPYLHNGSVANQRELLEEPAKRSVAFYRGSDIYDPVNIGFLTNAPATGEHAWFVDTRVRGNGNGGHTYGTSLAPAEKEALLEYLKTL
jgi:hypothetical protein